MRLQTLCSFSVRLLQHFRYESDITNPMFVVRWISTVDGEISDVTNSTLDFRSISERLGGVSWAEIALLAGRMIVLHTISTIFPLQR